MCKSIEKRFLLFIKPFIFIYSDFQSLMSNEGIKNNQLAFSVAETSLGISPVMSPQEMVNCSLPDKLTMVSYLSQFYHKFKKERIAIGKALVIFITLLGPSWS
jgi:hypothetical protein